MMPDNPLSARPIQPTIRKQVAQLLASVDPRCDFDDHSRIALGGACPHCHLDLFTYLECVPRVWPA
jgi:hypothetical protein